MTQLFRNVYPSHAGNRKTFELMTSTYPIGTFALVASFLAESSVNIG